MEKLQNQNPPSNTTAPEKKQSDENVISVFDGLDKLILKYPSKAPFYRRKWLEIGEVNFEQYIRLHDAG